MPILIIALVWIGVASLFVALCRVAGEADRRRPELGARNGHRAFLVDVVLVREAPLLAARDLRPASAELARAGSERR
jgi:hypothetical protein